MVCFLEVTQEQKQSKQTSLWGQLLCVSVLEARLLKEINKWEKNEGKQMNAFVPLHFIDETHEVCFNTPKSLYTDYQLLVMLLFLLLSTTKHQKDISML